MSTKKVVKYGKIDASYALETSYISETTSISFIDKNKRDLIVYQELL
jgi:hypothetical protein